MDVKLILGIIYYQEKNYELSKKLAIEVLNRVPTYTDARILLITSYIELNEYTEAMKQVNIGHHYAPDNGQIKILENMINKNSQTAYSMSISAFKEKENRKPEFTYKEISALKNAGQLQKAKSEALKYLKVNSKDYDVMLVLGSVYYQEKNYVEARKYLQIILNNFPKYTDARALLIQILMIEKEFKEAQSQLKIGYKYSPNDKQLKEVATKLTLAIKDATLPKPKGIDSVEKQYSCKQKCAQEIEKDATYFYNLKQYHVAVAIANEALFLDPQNKKAKEVIANTKSASPKYLVGLNEFGVLSQQDHVSDLDQWWNYSSLYYRRHASSADIHAIVNYAQRRGLEGIQEEVLLIPVLNKYARMEVDVAFSSRFQLFPRFLSRVEGFFSIPKFLDFSIGENYSHLNKTYFTYTTGSITKETANLYLSLRPYHFKTKNGPDSTLYILNTRLYIKKDVDHYIWATFGTGKSPDLNDLELVSFFTITNNFVYVGYHFPANNNKVAFNLGVDYQKQGFPFGKTRILTGGIIGAEVRF